MRKQIVAALAGVLGLVGSGQGQEAPTPPVPVPASTAPAGPVTFNQRMANGIIGYLRAAGHFRNCSIDVTVTDGIVDVNGQVNDPYQKAEAIRIVRYVPGVRGVRDNLTCPGMMPVMPVAGVGFPPAGFPGMPAPGMPTGMPTGMPRGGPFHAGGIVQAQEVGPLPKDDGKLPEPLSIMPMPFMPSPAFNPPPMPPYAWPTYAPYNNISRVAHPELYPYEAWPFIGPMYPFPKVPPGWRAVTLRWQDGHWWYGRKATGHDWWRVRYW